MKKILITGGCGFLGSHLVDALLKNPENQITVLDNFSTSAVDANIWGDKVEVINESISPYLINFYFNYTVFVKYDEIYHLASVVGPVGVLKHGGDIVRSVLSDYYVIRDYCLKYGAKLLDVSTSEVYGGGKDGYCSETFPKIIPPETTIRLEYAVAKLAAETSLINTVKMHPEFDAKIIRPFNISGSRQQPNGGFVLPRFVQQALKNDPLTVYGNGKQIRAFTYVGDIANGLQRCMKLGRSGEAYNLGNPMNKISILDLAVKVIDITKSSSTIEYVDPVKLHGIHFAEAANKFPDSLKANEELKWFPTLSIMDIIKEYLAWYKKEIQNAS